MVKQLADTNSIVGQHVDPQPTPPMSEITIVNAPDVIKNNFASVINSIKTLPDNNPNGTDWLHHLKSSGSVEFWCDNLDAYVRPPEATDYMFEQNGLYNTLAEIPELCQDSILVMWG